MRAMKDQASSATSALRHEIDIAWLEKIRDQRGQIKPQVDQFVFADGKRLTILAAAAWSTSAARTATRRSSCRALLEPDPRAMPCDRPKSYPLGVHVLPKKLTKRSRAPPGELGVELTKLTSEQAAYLGVPVDGTVQTRSLSVLVRRHKS